MRRRALLLVLVTLAVGPAAAQYFGPGVHDRVGLLSKARRQSLSAQVQQFGERTETEFAVVIVRGDSNSRDGDPADAQAWLTGWREAPEEGSEEGNEPASTSGQGELEQLRFVVLHLNVAKKLATVAVTPNLAAKFTSETRAEIAKMVQPALAERSAEAVGKALSLAVQRVSVAAGLPAPAKRAVAQPAPEVPSFVMPAPRPWLRPLWLVALPTALMAVLLWWRGGLWQAVAATPLVLLLYSGLYLLLRFRPTWFMVVGALAVAPLVFWIMTPPRAGKAAAPADAAWRHGGFGTTGFAGLGLTGR